MRIIGCDYHPGFQQIAFVDTETGDCGERRLQHREEAEKFYRDLAAQGVKVRVGMEASGHARWFERLLAKVRSQSVFRSGTQSDPCISSIATSTMILSSNSSVRRSGTPSQFLGVLLHTTAIFGLSRVRTESVHLLVIPFLTHHPEQLNG